MSEISEAEKVAKIAAFGFDKAERRTKRRYAHELYPHPADDEIRPLSVEVPYLYARAVGFQVHGTGWFGQTGSPEKAQIALGRTEAVINAREIAFLADALLQGLAGEAAWRWAAEYASDETGELAYDRAAHYKVRIDDIKPYPCGDDPSYHDHLGEPDSGGWRTVTRAPGAEDDCEECTEVVSS
jgi:hypothetical protein